MFFLNTYRRHKKIKNLLTIFSPTYELKENFKFSKYTVPILLKKYQIAVEFGEYNNSNKRIQELEKMGLKIFNIPDSEDIFVSAGRLLYVITNVKISNDA